MRNDYIIKAPTQKIVVEVEETVAKTLLEMEKHAKISTSELANTALKRFISAHSDFLPPKMKG